VTTRKLTEAQRRAIARVGREADPRRTSHGDGLDPRLDAEETNAAAWIVKLGLARLSTPANGHGGRRWSLTDAGRAALAECGGAR
jgi:hypothetical protein